VFAFAEVEIAVGACRAQNADKGDSKSTMPSGAEKKSSFATDEWLVQRETAKKMDIQSTTSEQDNVSSLQDAWKIVSASDCSSAGQPAGSKWTTSNRHETAENVEQSELYKRRYRSRSPLDNTNSVAEISHTEQPAKSCRIFIRYGNASPDCLPTEDNIREIFSVHGHILGMLYLKPVLFIKLCHH